MGCFPSSHVMVTYRRDLALLESTDDAVNLQFSVNIRLLLLDIRRFVDTCSHFCVGGLL